MNAALKASPLMGFTLCYVTSHIVLDILDEEQAQAIMDYCVDHFDGE